MFAFYRMSLKQFLFWMMVWTFIGIVLAQTEIANATQSGFTGDAWQPWSWAFTAVYAYALVTPIIIYSCYLWSFDKGQIISTFTKLLLLYLPVTLVFITLMLTLRYLVYWLMLGEVFPHGEIVSVYFYEFPKSFTFYFAVIFATYARIFQQKEQQEKITAARLHGELLDAKLEVLQHQLQPHFLFNTLNLISSTMYQNVDKADSIITRLADLLRYSLATQQKPFVTLQQELDAMKSYLEIAQLRFGERLSTELQISTEAQSVMIPVMLLQPLLENAVKYGIEPSDNGGSILLSANISENKMTIKIVNSLHQQTIQSTSFGIGLENTKKRLKYLYQDKASLLLTKIADDKIELVIILPIERI